MKQNADRRGASGSSSIWAIRRLQRFRPGNLLHRCRSPFFCDLRPFLACTDFAGLFVFLAFGLEIDGARHLFTDLEALLDGLGAYLLEGESRLQHLASRIAGFFDDFLSHRIDGHRTIRADSPQWTIR